jgi:hypothetical protein
MGLSMSKQEKLEHREMKFYKKYYPGVHVECRGPSYPSLVYPLGKGWVSVIPEDTEEYKTFLKDFKTKFHVQSDVQVGVCRNDNKCNNVGLHELYER